MFASWYLSRNALGVENIFLITVGIALVYCVASVIYAEGRTLPAIKRSLIGLAVAEVMTDFSYYLGYIEYFPGYDSLGEPARIFPGIVLPIIFFLCSWLFVKIMNNMLR